MVFQKRTLLGVLDGNFYWRYIPSALNARLATAAQPGPSTNAARELLPPGSRAACTPEARSRLVSDLDLPVPCECLARSMCLARCSSLCIWPQPLGQIGRHGNQQAAGGLRLFCRDCVSTKRRLTPCSKNACTTAR